MAQALTLVDGLAVIGGGLSGASSLFLPSIVDELNGTYAGPDGQQFRRPASVAFNLEDPAERKKFLQAEAREIRCPGSRRKMKIDQ